MEGWSQGQGSRLFAIGHQIVGYRQRYCDGTKDLNAQQAVDLVEVSSRSAQRGSGSGSVRMAAHGLSV